MLAVTQALEHELRQRAVILVLTEMNWASSAVWVLLDHVLTELARTSLFVMVSTTQSMDQDDLLAGRHGISMVRLGPLRDTDSRRLLEEVGAELSEEATEELVARGGGNPYFLEELAGFVASGAGSSLTVSARSAAESGPDLDELPDTLRGIVAARLDSLEPAQRALLEDASVLGRSGSLPGLATLVKEVRGSSDFDEALASLVAQDLLSVTGSRYEFQSDLVRDVAYGTLTKTVRAQRHAGIASYLENAQPGRLRNSVVVAIAEHYRAAAQLASELSIVPNVDRAELLAKALSWLDQAGYRALAVGESVQAERWFDHGVDLARDNEALPGFLFGRAKARCEIRDIVGARGDLDRLDPLVSQDQAMAARALVVRGDVDRKAGDRPGCSPTARGRRPAVRPRRSRRSSCLLYTSPSPRDATLSRMPSSA